jgi:dehydro coenzyme F420 reductase / coenzyme F420-0:L-glutamate ligase / coenzyme F420-1:gamma-L-glutamate ligase
VSIEVLPLEGLPEVRPGDDLVAMLADPLRRLGVRDGDVVVVTQKVVSKAEGRIVHGDDRRPWIDRETVRVVARRGELVIAETRHGFVCANAGVDASNVEPGMLALLPDDPDGSAERLRAGLGETLGASLAVVITDTFGRAWREGLVNVAIGVAGLPAVVDLRGSADRTGRDLEATVVALADEIAAASGLVAGKAAGIPASVVRGAAIGGAPPGRGRDLVRTPAEDLFRESPLQSLHARRTIRAFGPGDVPHEAIEEAVRAACTAPAPHHTRPWRFTALTSEPAKRALLAAMAEAWRADLRRDGVTEDVISRRIAASDGVLGLAPALIVPWVSFAGSHRYGDAERAHAEQEMFLLSGGAAIQNLLLALHAQGLASCWISSTLFCQEETRSALGVDEGWFALGTVACGPMPEGGAVPPRPPFELDHVLRFGD